MYAIDPNGYEKWRYALPGAVKSIALGHDNSIYIVFKEKRAENFLINKIYSINPNGTKNWEFEFPLIVSDSGDWSRSIQMSHVAVGPYGTIYITVRYSYCYSDCGYSYIDDWAGKFIVYAINPEGIEDWQYELCTHYNGGGSEPEDIIIGSDETIYVNIQPGNGYFEDLYALTWYATKKWSLDDYFFSLIVDNNQTIYTSGLIYPELTEENPYPAAEFSGMFALNPDLSVKWHLDNNSEVSSPSWIIRNNNSLYYIDRYLYAITGEGEKAWMIQPDNYEYFYTPVVGTNGMIYAATSDGYLHAFDEAGNEIWEFDTGSEYNASSPVIVQDGTLYIGSGKRLYAINTESGGLAESDWPIFAHDPRHTNSLAGPDPDNDGINTIDEDINQNRIVDEGETDPYKIDTDGDGIQDGTESGITIAMIGWDTDKTIFLPDLNPDTKTNPIDADTDDDGIPDGVEDNNHNGRMDAGETAPWDIDTDGDGIQDGTELGYTLLDICLDTDTGIFLLDLNPETKTNPLDADTDDDGIPDGVEDANHNGRVDAGETDPLCIDTDNDGIQDGTERGYNLANVGLDTELAVFQPDMDPGTKTNPLKMDTDGDGLSDGDEDNNHNGRVDEGETDPNAGKAIPWLMLLLSD